jgi:hypothetical protein
MYVWGGWCPALGNRNSGHGNFGYLRNVGNTATSIRYYDSEAELTLTIMVTLKRRKTPTMCIIIKELQL